jgi:NAD-specific glutamate dehydrogenase
MQTKLDEAKAELLERAARVAENSPVGGHLPTGTTDEGTPDRDTVLAFLQRYYLHTAPEDLADRDPVDVFGAAFSHYRLAETRPQGTANVRVHTPTVEENGWTCSHSVVEVVTDDMPFLVDSVTNELTRQGRGIHVVIHPQVVVRRDLTGKLIEVLTTPPAGELPHDAHIESWIHVEIDRETDRADLKQITADLLRVLSDVREAVEDWEKMRDSALRMADELPTEPTASDLPSSEVEEARELLRWLAADHFTFLGYREYQLREDDSLAAVPGTGLGILRSDPQHGGEDSHPVSPSFERLPADARAKAREHKLLVLTKANSRSTVHRPSYLDYVGVKKFDENGEVVGERRFLGLFSSAAYTESVRRVPVIRRTVDEVLEGAGFSPNSHDGRDLLQILETYPRDELFQTPVDELRSIVTSVLYLQERRRLRLYLRQDEYGRYYSALVYLPRDRYTTGVRLRIIDILKEELDGTSVDFTAWNTESILSRLHFVVRVPQGTELPELSDADKDRIEARLVEAARSWADGFGEALNAECGEERAAELLRSYGNAFPEGYKADHSPRAAVADLVHLEQLTEEQAFALSLYEPVGAAPDERRFKIYRKGASVSLSAVLPVLSRLGVEVVDERPYELRCSNRTTRGSTTSGCGCPSRRTATGTSRRRLRDLSSIRRVSKACTCASARSRAAACAGPTGARISAPRSSAWSRRSRSRTPSSCRSAPRAASCPSSCRRPSNRDAWLAEGIASYKIFIARCSTSPTISVATGRAARGRRAARRRRPLSRRRRRQGHRDLLRHRQRDLAESYGFWLGDAFASGGSAGYDHKKMGITARGAWESVKRHFRELARRHPDHAFTVVGVGDMSGDVFGNGMLLAEHIRLVAAFDHRDIFIDPSPDAAISFAERQRMFELPRSSWAGLRQVADLAGRRRVPAFAQGDPARRRTRPRGLLGIDKSPR